MFGFQHIPLHINGLLGIIIASIITFFTLRNNPNNKIPLIFFSIWMYCTSVTFIFIYFGIFKNIDLFLLFGSSICLVIGIVINQFISYSENKELWLKRVY
jgi:hypothetical protein